MNNIDRILEDLIVNLTAMVKMLEMDPNPISNWAGVFKKDLVGIGTGSQKDTD